MYDVFECLPHLPVHFVEADVGTFDGMLSMVEHCDLTGDETQELVDALLAKSTSEWTVRVSPYAQRICM